MEEYGGMWRYAERTKHSRVFFVSSAQLSVGRVPSCSPHHISHTSGHTRNTPHTSPSYSLCLHFPPCLRSIAKPSRRIRVGGFLCTFYSVKQSTCSA